MSFDPKERHAASLDRAYVRARTSPAFIASLIAVWERAFSNDAIEAIGADLSRLPSLGLCLRPREDHWAEDIGEIAQECGLEPARLAAFLRQALVAERLASSPPAREVVDGRLLAARDRDDGSQK
jgi:hypothetical protein